jgi:hypothetical protein
MSPTIQCSRHGMVRESRSHLAVNATRHHAATRWRLRFLVAADQRLPREFCGSGKSRHLGGSDVVLTKQCNTCKHRDYVGQASRRYRPDTGIRPIRPIGPIREDTPTRHPPSLLCLLTRSIFKTSKLFQERKAYIAGRTVTLLGNNQICFTSFFLFRLVVGLVIFGSNE